MHTRWLGVLWLVLGLILVMPASADFWDDVVTEIYIENVSQLPALSGLQPEKNWQPSSEWFSDHCRRKYSPYFVGGWLDIVGFERMVKIDGVFYINESPETAVIIRYETLVCALGYPRYKGGWNYKLDTYQQDDQFVAKLTATAILYYYYNGYKYYDNITKVFYDYEPLPERFIIPGNQLIILKQYNGSVYKPQVLNFNLSPSVISYKVTATNGSLKQYISAGHVFYTGKNVPYMNLTATAHYEQSGHDVSKLNDEVVINSNLINIEFFTPYGKLNTSANITKIQMPKTHIKSGVFGLIFIVFVFFGGLYVMGKTLL